MIRRIGSVMLMALIVSSCGGAGAPAVTAAIATSSAQATTDPRLQTVIDGAKAEGAKLDLTWGSYANKDMVEQWKQGFERLYGIKPAVTLTPEPAMNQMAAKLVQEFKANRPASTDVFLSTDVHILTLQTQGPDMIQKVDWSWSKPISATPKVVEGDGQAIHFVTSLRGITYNADKVKGADVPKSFADVLRLSTKFSVASTPQASVFETVSTPDIWGEQRTVQYITELSKNIKGLIQGQELNRVSTGEFDIFLIDYGKNEVDTRKAQGQNLAWSFASDAPIVTPVYLSIPKNAAHPNMAKLWLSYVMSREAQDLLMKYEYLDNVLLPGSKNAEEIKKLDAAGVKYYQTSVEFAKKYTDNYTRVRTQLQKILSKQ